MMVKVKLTHHDGTTIATIKCPGCKLYHSMPVTGEFAWYFNGDLERPTFTPSIKGTLVMHASDKDFEKGVHICHSYVADGFIQFLNDCTHSFGGQTLELPEID